VAKRRLLLADDSTTIQKVVNLTFADEGIEVVAVGDGDAAMQKFVEATPDLVMLDVNMPGLDGYRLCEMIKQDDETKEIPVILLVGSFEPFDENEARRVGADDFLTKPFPSIRQLVNKVSDLLDAKTSTDNSLYLLEDAPGGDFAEISGDNAQQ
jgi:CheY-like chemotaxis protein